MQTFDQQLQHDIEPNSNAEIYQNINRLMHDQNSDINDFIGIVCSNIELSDAILKATRDISFDLTGEIDNVSRAIRMIGIGETYSMITRICGTSDVEKSPTLVSTH